jgi:hypothetical protein
MPRKAAIIEEAVSCSVESTILQFEHNELIKFMARIVLQSVL